MIRWALQSLWQERLIASACAIGIALALVLGLYLDAVFRGESDQIVVFLERAPADVFVLQEGVEDVHMARSTLTDLAVVEASEVDGVAEAIALVYRDVLIGEIGAERIAYLVGVPEKGTALRPWNVPFGSAEPAPGEVVVPHALAASLGVGLGDTVRVAGRELVVTGLSMGTFSMANPLLYVAEAEARELVERPDGANLLLLRALPGLDPETLAERVRSEVEDVEALTAEQLVRNDYEIGMQMGGSLVRMMTAITAAVSALIVVFAAFAFVANRRRELAVARALGARGATLVAVIVLQVSVIAIAGCLLATAALPALELVIGALVPEVAVHFSWRMLAAVALATLSATVVASLAPAASVLRTDPTSVFSA